MSQFKAVIFDMDGVLVDTENYYAQRRAEFFGTHRIPINHMKPTDFIGGNMKDIWPMILGENFDEKQAKNFQKAYSEFKEEQPLPYEELLFPDVRDILDYLQKENYKIALASSSAMFDIDKMLEIHGLRPYFQAIFSGNDLKVSKPHPEIYQLTMKALAVDPTECLIIEDSEKGIAAGKAANATVWAIEDVRFGMNQSAADKKVASLTAIMQLLDQ